MTNKEREEIAKAIAEKHTKKRVLKKSIPSDSLNPEYDEVAVKKVTVAMPYGHVYLDVEEGSEGEGNLKQLAQDKGWSLHEFEFEAGEKESKAKKSKAE